MQDLLIIGGGINGVGIARDAVGRGLKVTLVEKGDLASQTSSWSTKLIHGGIRYLENYEFRLVRESLKEREVIKSIAPQITKPIRFVMPHVSHLRPSWMIRIGLFLYDKLGGMITLPKSKYVNLTRDYVDNPIKEEFKKGYEYSDLQVDDSRLVLLNAQDAINRGAKIITNISVVDTKRNNNFWEIKLSDNSIIKSKVLINATGPFVVDVLKNICHVNTNKSLRLVQGSHLIINKIYDGDHAYILQLNDKRVVFMIPFHEKYTLIGTTDKEVNTYEYPKISIEEIDYLLDSINSFLKVKISKDDIIWTYSGVRPLVNDKKENVSKVTRDYEFELDKSKAPILSIFGGKLTTYRKLAEHALEKLSVILEVPNQKWTDSESLPGATINNKDYFNGQIPIEMKKRFNESYGSYNKILFEYFKKLPNGGEKICKNLFEFEVAYLMEQEMATTTEDILFRRTKLGIDFPKDKLFLLDEIIKKYSKENSVR